MWHPPRPALERVGRWCSPNISIVLHHVSVPSDVLTVTLTQTGDGGTLVDWHQEFENPDVASESQRWSNRPTRRC